VVEGVIYLSLRNIKIGGNSAGAKVNAYKGIYL